MKKAFQTHIIMRYMPEEEMDKFLDIYNNARIKSGRERRVACLRDHEIYRKFKAGAFIQDLAEEYGRSYWWIYRSIKLAKDEIEGF